MIVHVAGALPEQLFQMANIFPKTMLFLDDVRKPYSHHWDLVKSFKAFVDYIDTHGVPDCISFDHDLAPEHYPWNDRDQRMGHDIDEGKYNEKTGYHCALYLVEHQITPKLCIVHSFNPEGAKKIAGVLNRYLETRVIVCPYTSWT